MEETKRHMGRAMCMSMRTYMYIDIERGTYEYGTEHKTSSVQNTGRQTGREESRHTRHTGLNVLAKNRRNCCCQFPRSGLKVDKTRFQRFLRGKNVQIEMSNFMRSEWRDKIFFERHCGWQNEATLLKQTLKDRYCVHAAGALQLNALKSFEVSTINTRKFD